MEAVIPVFLEPTMDIVAIINRSPPGMVFQFRPGVYRVSGIKPADGQVLVGEDGAILNGSLLLGSWTEKDGTWRTTLPRRSLPRSGQLGSNSPLNGYREDLFIDNRRQRRVATIKQLEPGTWFHDLRLNQAVLGNDPGRRTVEIGSAEMAISGNASNVQIRNLTVEKYATAPQVGAIHGHHGKNWVLRGVVARWNHGSGLNIGEGFLVEGGQVYENGQLGIGGGLAHGATIRSVEVFGNNYAGYDGYWEAGGVKIADSRNVTFIDNHVYRNDGVGLWGDIDMIDTRYFMNTVVENTLSGIMHEVSYRAWIEGNAVLRNGLARRDRITPSQILVQNAQNVEVRCNLVEVAARAGNGITMVYANRGGGIDGPWDTKNNTVSHNTIIHLDGGGVSGFLAGYNKAAAYRWPNTWSNNHYIVPVAAGRHWEFGEGALPWTEAGHMASRNNIMTVERRRPFTDLRRLTSPPRPCP